MPTSATWETRLPALVLFAACCFTAHAYFPEDIFSAQVTWPLLVVRMVDAIIVVGILVAARRLGRVFLYGKGALEYFLSTLVGIAWLSLLLHLPSAFNGLRFAVVGPILCGLVCWGAPLFVADVKGALNRVRAATLWEKLAWVGFLLLLLPVALRASLPFFTNDELTMYLPQLREFARQGSFAPVPRIEMLNTFTTGGFSLLTLAYVLGGDGAAIYLSFAYLLLTAVGLYGFLTELGRSRLAYLAPAFFFLLCQVIITDHPESPQFVDGGMGLSKLHSLTTLCLLGELTAFLLYLRQPTRATASVLVLLLAFTAGVQLLGMAALGLFLLGLLLNGRRPLDGRAMLASLGFAALWYLKPWLQVGCPFPVVIAPAVLTDLCLNNASFYPAFYNHHFRHLFQGQDAMGGLLKPWETLPGLLQAAPFNLIALALPACLVLPMSGFKASEARCLKAVLLLTLVALFLRVPNPRYFLYLFPLFTIVFLGTLEAGAKGRFSATGALIVLVLFSQGLATPRSRLWLFSLDRMVAENFSNAFLLPLPQMQQLAQTWLEPRLGATPFWARHHLAADSRVLHNNIDQWYFANRATYQMNTTLGAAAYQPSIEDIIRELQQEGITHFFYSAQPLQSCPDHGRFYTPLYERATFVKHFKLIHGAADGLLFSFHPRGVEQPDPRYLLPIGPEELNVRVWR